MQFLLKEDGSLEPLPKRNIDTGLGLDRLAAILQDVPVGVRERPVPARWSRSARSSPAAATAPIPRPRALRVLADHSRAMTFLIADGVVPSNEDRGYILRRIMRRAIQQGRAIGLESPFLGPLRRQRDRDRWATPIQSSKREQGLIHEWLASEEESFGRTLEQGTRLLARGDRAGEGRGHVVGRRATTPSSCTTRSASPTTSPGSCSRRRGCPSTTRASAS